MPNGEKRDRVTACILKKMGVVAGIPDLCIPLTGGRMAWLELKTKKGSLSAVQVKKIAELRALGHIVHVGYGFDDSVEWLKELRKSEGE